MNEETPIYADTKDIESCEGVIIEVSEDPGNCAVFTFPEKKFIVCTSLNIKFSINHETRAEIVCYDPDRSRFEKNNVQFICHKYVKKFESVSDAN